jgi:prepilin-type N-terminal cleavage/methylation domain-containing protein/prepilin-type processing-associated H-X9-DG protein
MSDAKVVSFRPAGSGQGGAPSTRRGFTMVELLVTMTVIVILVALAFPALGLALAKAKGSKCAGNLRQFYLAAEQFSQDNDGMSLPAQTLDGNTTIFWHWKLRPYLGASSIWNDDMDPRLTCPACPKTHRNYWGWGYGMNSRPGYEGASTTSSEGRFNWEEVNVKTPANWKGTFKSVAITHKSQRLFLCDSTEWQVTPSSTGNATFPEYTRHGKTACNVLFYDGHVESAKKAAINKALYDPAGK